MRRVRPSLVAVKKRTLRRLAMLGRCGIKWVRGRISTKYIARMHVSGFVRRKYI